jgi:hypothetical protein
VAVLEIMIDELLKQWTELQTTPFNNTVGDVQKKANREIEIAQALQRAGYTGDLNNGFSLQEIIDSRQKGLRYMNDRIREITS